MMSLRQKLYKGWSMTPGTHLLAHYASGLCLNLLVVGCSLNTCEHPDVLPVEWHLTASMLIDLHYSHL